MAKHFIFFSLAFFIVTGCAPSDLALQNMHGKNTTELVWPLPPYEPRIKYIRTISGSLDMDLQKTWFSRIIDTLAGKTDMGEFMLKPHSVCSVSGKVYVTDPGLGLVHIYDLPGRQYSRIEKADGDKLFSPLGIAVTARGEVFLTDSVLRKIYAYNEKGEFLREIGSDSKLERPTGIAVDADRVYVVDTLAHQILVFDQTKGQLLFRFGQNGKGNGEFHYPTHIFFAHDKRLYITDSLNFRVQIFNRDGNFLSAFGRFGDAMGDFSKPKGIAVDSDGNIYVADSEFDNVQIFDQSGRLLLILGGSGSQPGRMSLPSGVFIDKNDRVYVTDSYNRRVQVFQYLGKNLK